MNFLWMSTLSLLCVSISALCPSQTKYDNLLKKCVFVTTRALSFSDAQSFCQSIGGDLVSIRNEYENKETAISATEGTTTNQRVYTGAHLSGNGWIWPDQSKVTYTNWEDDQPAYGNCAVIQSTTGKWRSVFCEVPWPFICTVGNTVTTTTTDPKTTTVTTAALRTTTVHKSTTTTMPIKQKCLEGWSSSADTTYCYHVSRLPSTFRQAEAICRALESELASVHSQLENDYIAGLAVVVKPFSSVVGYPVPSDSVPLVDKVWLGGSSTNMGLWTWSDGTPVDYTNFVSYKGNGAVAMNVQFATRGFAQWTTLDENTQLPYFICKKWRNN